MANKKNTVTTPHPTRKQNARKRKDAQLEQKLRWAAIAVGVLLVGILLYGFITEVIIKSRIPIAEVGETTITTQQYQERVRYERNLLRAELNIYNNMLFQFGELDPEYSQQLQSAITSLQTQLSPELAVLIGNNALDQMIEEALVRQEAEAQGLTITDDELQTHIRSLLEQRGFMYPTGSITESQTLTATQQFAEGYDIFLNYIRGQGMSRSEFEEMAEAQALIPKVQELLIADLDLETQQVELVYLVASTEEEIQALYERIEAGEDPLALVEELNINEDFTTGGGQLPWMSEAMLGSQIGEAFELAVSNTPVGGFSEPVLGSDGNYYLIQVLGREMRPLDAFALSQYQQTAYAEWLAAQRAEKVEILGDTWREVTPIQP